MWNGEVLIIKEGQILTGRKELSRQTGIPETTIERALSYFEKNGHQIGQQKTNKFRLITVINWKEYQECGQQSGHQTDIKRTSNGHKQECNNDKNDKNLVLLRNTSDEGIKKIMDIFYKINPTLNWGNKTYRKAASDLIHKFTLEEAVKMAQAVVSVQGQKYAPRATNPYQMWSKIADFKFYFDSLKNKRREVFQDV